MQRKYLLVLGALLLIAALASGYIRIDLNRTGNPATQQAAQQQERVEVTNCKPTFADGGGPYYNATRFKSVAM